MHREVSIIRPLHFLLAAASLLVCSCSNEGPQTVASLEISPASVDVPLGTTRQLHVTALDAESHSIGNPSLAYTSSNTAVATVSSSGLVAGKATGFDTITVTSGSVSAIAAIAVVTHPAGTSSGSPPVASRPFAVAVSGTNLAFAGRQDLPYLQLTQLPDSSFRDSANVGNDPTDIVFTSTGATAYVTNQASGNVGIIDVTAKQSVDSFPIAQGSPFRILAGKDDQHVYISTSTGAVLEFVTATKANPRAWPLSGPVNGLAFRPDGTILYATTTTGNLYEITLATGGVRVDSIGGTLQDIAVSLDAAELYIADEGGDVEVLQASTGQQITTVTGATGVFGLTLSRDGTQLYGSIPGAGQVVIIDRATRTVTKTLSLGGMPRRIAFSRLGTEALIPNESGFISVVK